MFLFHPIHFLNFSVKSQPQLFYKKVLIKNNNNKKECIRVKYVYEYAKMLNEFVKDENEYRSIKMNVFSR